MDVLATALPALGDAWALILQPVVLGYLVLGVVMGLAVGVFPGLGGIAGLSLLMPFMFGMEPVDAFVTKTCEDGLFDFYNLPENATAEFGRI